MSEKSNIEWYDSTVNFWSGCTKVSDGCKNCYAEARDKRHMVEPVSHWGKGAPRLKHKGAVKDALALNRKPWICDACGEAFTDAQKNDENFIHFAPDGKDYCGFEKGKTVHHVVQNFHRRNIFSNSLSDWLDEEVPIEWLAEMLDTIRRCDQVTWILCTKRPENWRDRLAAAMVHLDKDTPRASADEEEILRLYLAGRIEKPVILLEKLKRTEIALWIGKWLGGGAPQYVVLLTSVENQVTADFRVPALLSIPATYRGLSLEPLLGPIDFSKCYAPNGAFVLPNGIDWLIIGGESGPGARACNVDWIRSLVRQGQAAGVATFVKQLGAFPCLGREDSQIIRHKKGGDISEWPMDIRIQKWPRICQ